MLSIKGETGMVLEKALIKNSKPKAVDRQANNILLNFFVESFGIV